MLLRESMECATSRKRLHFFLVRLMHDAVRVGCRWVVGAFTVRGCASDKVEASRSLEYWEGLSGGLTLLYRGQESPAPEPGAMNRRRWNPTYGPPRAIQLRLQLARVTSTLRPERPSILSPSCTKSHNSQKKPSQQWVSSLHSFIHSANRKAY